MKNQQVFIFQYDPTSSFEGLFKEFWAVVDGKQESVESHIIRSNSIEALTSNLTKNRLQLFATIVEKKPTNLTELAHLLKKDYSQVRREARILEAIGLIELSPIAQEVQNHQGTRMSFKEVKPIALYQRIVFDFPIPAGMEEVEKPIIRPSVV